MSGVRYNFTEFILLPILTFIIIHPKHYSRTDYLVLVHPFYFWKYCLRYFQHKRLTHSPESMHVTVWTAQLFYSKINGIKVAFFSFKVSLSWLIKSSLCSYFVMKFVESHIVTILMTHSIYYYNFFLWQNGLIILFFVRSVMTEIKILRLGCDYSNY